MGSTGGASAGVGWIALTTPGSRSGRLAPTWVPRAWRAGVRSARKRPTAPANPSSPMTSACPSAPGVPPHEVDGGPVGERQLLGHLEAVPTIERHVLLLG